MKTWITPQINEIKKVPNHYPYGCDNVGNVWNLETLKKSRQYRKESGYNFISLFKEYKFKKKEERVHRLVGFTWLDNPNNYDCINHKNGIKHDNRVENLEWCTKAQNNKHAYDTGLKTGSWTGLKGKDHHASKIVNQYDLNGKLLNTFYGAHEAGRILGISFKLIARCASGQRYSTKGYHFEYAK